YVRGEEKAASIVDNYMHAPIVEHTAIQRNQMRRGMENRGLDLDAIDLLNVRIAGDGRDRHPAAEANHQHLLQAGMEDCAKVTKNQLRAHVAGGRIGFAISAQRDK